ncbi:MAG: ABC transporter permease [Pseudomonadales bacterium]|nr:permease-like cell division protein FtsX [Pseudomonadales bacterium]MCP5347611.1 ABC transporter permease [Pseudomonadales bacterium]
MSAHLEVLGDSLRRFAAAPLSSAMTIFVIAIALLLPALLGLVADNLAGLGGNFQDSARITLFLTGQTDDGEAVALSEDLRSAADVASVSYTSRSQALAEFQAGSGLGGIVTELGDNPLPASLSVTPSNREPDAVQALVTRLQALPQVESVLVDLLWIQRLDAMQAVVNQLGRILALVLGLAVLFIVGNSIRTGIEQRQREIEVVRLVGGTAGYIARPFLYSGLLLGLFGATLACLLLMALQLAVSGPIDNLLSLYGAEFRIRFFTAVDALSLLAIGSLLGWSGAAISSLTRIYASPP